MEGQTNFNEIGAQIQNLRNQLGMSLENLSVRSKVDVKTIERLESGSTKIQLEQLYAIVDGLVAKLSLELKPIKPGEQILYEQARSKAKEIVRYVQGTMSLEAQNPSQESIEQLIESQTNKLLSTHKHLIWEEE